MLDIKKSCILVVYSGPDRGVCDCGVCKCKGFYIGVNCGQRNCSLLDFECRKDKDSVSNKLIVWL